MSIKELLLDDASDVAAAAAYLDALSHEARLDEVMALGKGAQIAMYDKAAASAPITLDHFVPPGTGRLKEVIHHGRNTLPAFKRFQKRFCLPGERDDQLFGYNEGSTRALIGPGFFVAHATAGNDEWVSRGAIVVDYFMVPDAPVVEGWPTVIPNNKGLQVMVYNHTRDFMRKVSEHVSIGAAFKNETAMGAYFVLVREDPE